jgi:pimeloyl-ACP methyl ester carboxylesterase
VPAQPESVFLNVNGLKLHHLAWGDPKAPPLVCVHGLGGNGHAFDGLARRMSDRYRVIAVDVRGRGDSDWAKDGAYSVPVYATDLEGIVDALGLGKFSLCGTSMGGRISMEYAGRHPERIERLVINDIGPDAEAGSDRITQNQANVPESFADIDEAVAYRRKTSSVFASQTLDEQRERMGYDLRTGEGGRLYWKHDPEWQRQRATGGTPTYGYLWDALRNLQAPTLLVWGTASDVLSEGQAKKIIETLLHGEMVAVPGVGHAPTLNEPAAIEALERFLSPVPAA